MLLRVVTAHVASKLMSEEIDVLWTKFRRPLQSSSQCAGFACGFLIITWRIVHIEEVYRVW